MPADSIVLASANTIEGKVVDVPSHEVVNEKMDHDRIAASGKDALREEIQPAPASDGEDAEKDSDSEDALIITGKDASLHLLSLRDDFDEALTFRSLALATCLSAFQAVMSQIYTVSSLSPLFVLF